MVAVEPVAGMREVLVGALPAADVRDATAEALPLPDGSVHAVLAASAPAPSAEAARPETGRRSLQRPHPRADDPGVGTLATLAAWNAAPWPVLRGWLALSLAITGGLLAAVLGVAALTVPDPTPVVLPGLHTPATLGVMREVVLRNALVLALHAMACVAGFIAGSALPREAQRYSGWLRRVHDRAPAVAMAFVAAATVFSLVTQAFALGHALSTLGAQLGLAPAALLALLLPHALPELVALFLPLAAWLQASRHGRADELLAATAATVALAAPVVVLAAAVEVFLTPRLLLHFV